MNLEVKARAQRQANKLNFKKIAAESFPKVGNVRANQCAAYLGIGLFTFWLFFAENRIKKPTKYGVRLSVRDAEYIHQLKANGITPAKGEAA